jgi:hypothetical protein
MLRCWEVDPSTRPTFEEIISDLEKFPFGEDRADYELEGKKRPKDKKKQKMKEGKKHGRAEKSHLAANYTEMELIEVASDSDDSSHGVVYQELPAAEAT